MLELAPTARPENRTEWPCARRRLTQNFDQIGNRVARFYLADSDAGELARNWAKAKDDDAVGAANALAVGEEIRKGELEFESLTQRRGGVRRCFSGRQAP